MDLMTLADQVGAAADLDDQARGRIDMELEFGDSEYVISIAVLETRTPLPTDLIAQLRAGVPHWYVSQSFQQQMLDALDRQAHANTK